MSLDELKMLDLVPSSVAEELFFCAQESLYPIKKEMVCEKEDTERSSAIYHANPEPTEEKIENPASLPVTAEKIDETNNAEYAVRKIGESNSSIVSEIVIKNKTELNDDRPIEVLPLSTRAYNCLKRARVDTIRQLSRMTTEELLEIRNLGRTTLEELTDIINTLMIEESLNAADGTNCDFSKSADTLLLQDLGLSMRTTACLYTAKIRTVRALLDCIQHQIPIPNLSKDSREEVINAVRRYQETAADSGNMKPDASETIPIPDDRPIETLNLSVRSFNCLKRAGIHTVQQLLSIPSENLLKIRNLGKMSASEIESVRRNYSPPPVSLPKSELSIEELKPLIMDAFVKPFKGLSFQEIKDAFW